MVPKHERGAEIPKGLSRQAYSDWLLAKRPATSEAEEAELDFPRLFRAKTKQPRVEAGITATVRPSGNHEDDGFHVDAPHVEWTLVKATLQQLGFRSPPSDEVLQ